MQTTIVCWGYIRGNGKENGTYYSILGLYWITCASEARCAVLCCTLMCE